MGGQRELNVLLRGARVALRETQEQTAWAISELLGHPVDPEYIGRLERGVVTWPHARYRDAFQRHFGVASPGELGFYCRRSQPRRVEADTVRRRVFFNAVPLPLVMSGEPLTRLVNLAHAEPDPIPRLVGREHVEQVRAMVTQAQELANRLGGGQVRDLLGFQIRWAVGLLGANVDPAVSDELHSAVGWLSGFGGWNCHDVGADTAAQHYFEVALHCGEQGGDWVHRADVYSCLARMFVYRGEGEAALTAAQQSQLRSDRLTPLARASAVAVEASAYGVRGDVQSALAAVGRAEEHFAAVVPANEAPIMLVYFSPAWLASDSGYALLPLALRGQHVQTTIGLLRSGVEFSHPGRARGRALDELRLAWLLFVQGDPAEAVAVATGALDNAGTVRSRRIVDLLNTLQRLAADPRYRGVPGLVPLRQRLTDTLIA